MCDEVTTPQVERLRRVLEKALENNWTGHIPAQIPIKLRLAVSLLARRHPEFWLNDPETVSWFLQENPLIKQKFEEFSERLLAFAIRERRM